MSRLVVVSNRVAPIEEGEATAGGLAAGVLDALRQTGGLWFGWSGEVADATEPRPERTVGAITLCTIDLSRQDYDEFYRGFANGTLWPVLHYQIGLGRFEWPEFAGYRRVNETFARVLAPLLRADDLVWVHDYHLLCLAAALRDLGVSNRVGLFLHTPFPAPGVFRTIPCHASLIEAMCAYDLIGFQTEPIGPPSPTTSCATPPASPSRRPDHPTDASRRSAERCAPASIPSGCTSRRFAPRPRRRLIAARPPACAPACRSSCC